MNSYFRLAVLFLLCVAGAILLSAGQYVRGNADSRGLESEDDPVEGVISAFQTAHFEPQNRYHQLRKQRIEHYLSLARKYDDNDWDYSRDDALARAQRILTHHQFTTGGTYARL